MTETGQEETRAELISSYGRKIGDAGSPEVQVALLTKRIRSLTEHFRTHKKDHNSRRGLIKLVSKRRGLLNDLERRDTTRYRDVIERLQLRR